MKVKKLAIAIFVIIFVAFTGISALCFNESKSVQFVCYKDSYAEKFADSHNMECEIIPEHNAYIGMVDLSTFKYNETDGGIEIISYNGESEKIAVPEKINEKNVVSVRKDAFKDAKNLTAIYLPKTLTKFEPLTLENITVYVYETSDLFKTFTEEAKKVEEEKADAAKTTEEATDTEKAEEEEKFALKFEAIPDSYYVDFYTGDIPYGYKNIENNQIELTDYYGTEKTVLIPQTIDGKNVSSISFKVLSNDIEKLIVPTTVTEIKSDVYTSRFNMDYFAGVIIAAVGMILAIILVLGVKDDKKSLFLNLPSITIGYTVSILITIVASVYLAFGFSVMYAIIATVVIIAVALIDVIKARTAADFVTETDNKIKTQTQFVKMATADAQNIMANAKTEEIKKACKSVYEALRYSDPMSNDALSVEEAKITVKMDELKTAVNSNSENVNTIADEIVTLVKERNNKCKALK